MSDPFLSIVTVCYNAQEVIVPTLESIRSQTVCNFEYIVVDGSSTDDTLKILEKYEGIINVLISEPDLGIYDAMNKGQRLAKGKFIWFINAGDSIPSPDATGLIEAFGTEHIDVIYGDAMLVNKERVKIGLRSVVSAQKLPKHIELKDMNMGMVVCHQSVLARTKLVEPYILNNLSADIDWLIRILKKTNRTLNTQMILADYLVDGLSKQRWYQSLKDRFSILVNHFGLVPTIFNHFKIVFRALKHKWSRRGQSHY